MVREFPGAHQTNRELLIFAPRQSSPQDTESAYMKTYAINLLALGVAPSVLSQITATVSLLFFISADNLRRPSILLNSHSMITLQCSQ